MEKYNTFDEDVFFYKNENYLSYNRGDNYVNVWMTLSSLIATFFVLGSFSVTFIRTTLPVKTSLASSSYETQVAVESPDYGIFDTTNLPWTLVVEPYRTQNIYISSLVEDDRTMELTASSYSAIWVIAGENYAGLTPTIMLNTTGAYDGSVVIQHKTKTYEYNFTVAVKYIRREIRTLTDADREAFFDALEIMYNTDDHAGKTLYGDKYVSAEYFSYKHLTGAGKTDCDHWHDGAGIVTHHMAFSLEMEQSLQSIDPRIAMPYWEYGMDTYLYDTWSQSPIFSSDWFGDSSPTNGKHAIDDGGRWTGILVPGGDAYMDWSISETGSLNPYVNAYGHMRSPWNNNPNRELGRHNMTYSMTQYASMPTCSTLQSCFKSTSLADINDCSNGATHGPVHILIGGAWGEGNLYDDPDVTMTQSPDKLLFFKVLWRMGYSRCPESCELGDVCKCSIPQKYIDEYGALAILKASNIYYALESDLQGADDELLEKVLRSVEDPGIAGEMFSSAAAFDPSFWPLHGQIERLLGAKRIMISQGSITNFDETWAFTEYNRASGAAYLNGVCDWSKVTGSGDLTLPTCTLDVICSGHNANDVLEFSNFLGEGETYTNQEFYDFMHPWNNDLPYTYDTWDFDYCEEQGYSFTGSDYQTSSSMLPPTGTGLPSDSGSSASLPMDSGPPVDILPPK